MTLPAEPLKQKGTPPTSDGPMKTSGGLTEYMPVVPFGIA